MKAKLKRDIISEDGTKIYGGHYIDMSISKSGNGYDLIINRNAQLKSLHYDDLKSFYKDWWLDLY